MGRYFRKKTEDIVAPFLMLAKEPIIPVTDRPVKVSPFELLFPFALFYNCSLLLFTLHMLVKAFPWLRGINFDLPHVVSEAVEFHGVEHVGGDMFQSVPKADAVFLMVSIYIFPHRPKESKRKLHTHTRIYINN
jgi:hypothetical protein